MYLPRTKLFHIIQGALFEKQDPIPGRHLQGFSGVLYLSSLNKKKMDEMSVVAQLYSDRVRWKGKECLLKKVFFCLWMWFSGCQDGENSINLHTNHSDVPSMYSKSGGWTCRLIQVEWGFVIVVFVCFSLSWSYTLWPNSDLLFDFTLASERSPRFSRVIWNRTLIGYSNSLTL